MPDLPPDLAAFLRQHMPKYLGEFTFRANHRQEVNLMFDRLIAKF